MSNTFRFFKCNIINGCRLADIERFVSRDEVFYLNSHIACTSRSVNAAVNSKWIIEITEKEASKTISIPKFVEHQIQKTISNNDVKSTNSSETKSNNAAYERYQARLQKLATSKKNKDEEIVDEIPDLEVGKNFNQNSAAEARIKNRSRKVKNIKDQENDFIKEFVEVEKEGNQNRIDISRQINVNKTTPKSEQFIKKSKVDMKSELEAKLNEKMAQKKTNEDEVKEDTEKTEKLKRKYNKKVKSVQNEVVDTSIQSFVEIEPPLIVAGIYNDAVVIPIESVEKTKRKYVKKNKVEKPIIVKTETAKRGRPKKIKE